MKQNWIGQLPLWVVILLVAVELTMWFDCYQTTEVSLGKDRFIATSTSCNEEAEIYRDRLDCTDIKRSLKSGTAWIRSGSCLLRKHNFFAMLGWMEIAVVGGISAMLLAVWAFFYLNYRQQNSVHQLYQDMMFHQRPGGQRALGHTTAHRTYRNGVVIEELDD